MHNYIIKVYITTVSLCNLYSYMFRYSCVIRQYTYNQCLAKLHTCCNLKNMCNLARKWL